MTNDWEATAGRQWQVAALQQRCRGPLQTAIRNVTTLTARNTTARAMSLDTPPA